MDTTSVEILDGSDQEGVDELDLLLSYHPLNYQYVTAYKKGRWDGYDHLIYQHRSGPILFSPGLLPRVIHHLDTQGYEYEIVEDLRREYPKTPFCSLAEAGYELRYFQEDALGLIERHKRGIVQAPPRAGKTLISIELFRRTSLMPFIFLVWKKEEAKQTRKSFEARLPGLRAGIIADGVCDIENKHVIVTTVASLLWANDLIEIDESKRAYKSRIKKDKDRIEDEIRPRYENYSKIRKLCREAKIVIWDEAHHAASDLDRYLSQKFRHAEYVVGLSGTPWRDDNRDLILEEVVGPILFHMPYKEAVDAKIILPLQVTAFFLPEFDYIITKGYPEAYRKAVANNAWYDRFIRRLVDHHRKRGETVAVIVQQKDHGRRLGREIPRSVFVYGNSKNRERTQGFESIQLRDGTCLISNLINEAIDLPSLDVVIVADVRKGSTGVFQRIRSMTVDVGKEIAQLVCFVPAVPQIRLHGVRALNLLRSEESFTVYGREVDEDGTIGPAKLLKPDRRVKPRGKLHVLPGATEGERRAARTGRGT